MDFKKFNFINIEITIKKILMFLAILTGFVFLYKKTINQNNLPVIAIANYGPHSSLEDIICGIKIYLKEKGFEDGKNIRYEIADVNFDLALIPQMVTQLKNFHPKVLVTLGTPISQFAKGSIKDIPIVFTVVTDPINAGLLNNLNNSENNLTGASDKQDLNLLLQFAQKIIPNCKKIGILYATAEANDLALLQMLKEAALKNNMEVVSIPIDQSREIPQRMQALNGNVDILYVGSSGTIQPTLPAIAAEAKKMKIPVFNVNEEAVIKHQILASFGVDYIEIGKNTGKIIEQILKGISITHIHPIYPTQEKHKAYISLKQAQEKKIEIPKNLSNLTIVE